MNRFLATSLFVYAILAASQWRNATQWLYAPPGRLTWCGNAVSDPFGLLVNVVVPLAAIGAAALILRYFKARHWPIYGITALISFTITTTGLVYEASVLHDYGIPIGRVWWILWR
jgi:hypothetical protein